MHATIASEWLVLVDDHVLAHEFAESALIQLRWHTRDLVLFPLLQNDFIEIFRFFLQVITLEVVNNRDVVNVPTIIRNEFMPRTFILILKLYSQFTYTNKYSLKKEGTYSSHACNPECLSFS